MAGADIIQAYAVGTTPTVTDRMASAEAAPPLDTSNDILNPTGSVTGGTTTIQFDRKLDTGDAKVRR